MYKDGFKSSYIVTDEFTKQNEQPNKQPNAQANEQPTKQANEQIITKLNLLFNYIIYNNAHEKFGNMTEKDRQAVRKVLERINIFISNPEILQYFSENQKFEYQLQYWAIKELYFSPYKVFLNKLTREQFLFRFCKAKKYMDYNNCSIYDFSRYFIKCIQEEMEGGNGINDRKNCK